LKTSLSSCQTNGLGNHARCPSQPFPRRWVAFSLIGNKANKVRSGIAPINVDTGHPQDAGLSPNGGIGGGLNDRRLVPLRYRGGKTISIQKPAGTGCERQSVSGPIVPFVETVAGHKRPPLGAAREQQASARWSATMKTKMPLATTRHIDSTKFFGLVEDEQGMASAASPPQACKKRTQKRTPVS